MYMEKMVVGQRFFQMDQKRRLTPTAPTLRGVDRRSRKVMEKMVVDEPSSEIQLGTSNDSSGAHAKVAVSRETR